MSKHILEVWNASFDPGNVLVFTYIPYTRNAPPVNFFSVPPYQLPMMELLGVMYCPGTTLTILIINKNSHPCRRLETAQMHKPPIFGILAILNHFLHTYLYGNTHHGQGN